MGMAEDEKFVAGVEVMGLAGGGGDDDLAALADGDNSVEEVLDRCRARVTP